LEFASTRDLVFGSQLFLASALRLVLGYPQTCIHIICNPTLPIIPILAKGPLSLSPFVRDVTSAVPFTSSRCGSNVAERSPWRSFRGSSAHLQLRPMVGFMTTTPLPLMQGHPACEPERSRAGRQTILRRVARPFLKSVVGVYNLQNAVTSTASRSSRVGRKTAWSFERRLDVAGGGRKPHDCWRTSAP
jgi:hypothetical protein